MKKLILLVAIVFPFTMYGADKESFSTDTVIYLENKKLEIIESGDRTRVRLYELKDHEDGYNEAERIFEGHYREGQSYESRKQSRTINISLPGWHHSDFQGHWEGFGMGFANFATSGLNINNVDGVSLRSGNSLEYNLNLVSYSIPFKGTHLGLVSGIGIRWNRYRINNGEYFKEVDGVATLLPLNPDYEMKASKLNTTSITIPLLLEWQNKWKSSPGKSHQLFFSAGLVAVIKTSSASRIVYYNEAGKKTKEKVDGGMNIRPVNMDILVQGGFRWIGAYAKYSPINFFEKNKGPKMYPVSLGLQFYW